MPLDTAMILAAGLGTRLKPFTNNHPKALALVNGKTLLHHNIEYLKSFGITKVVVNVHHFANQIINEIEKHNSWGIQVLVSDETNEVLETGGGLLKAKNLLLPTENFVLLNVDILTDLDLHKMYQAHLLQKAFATLAVTKRNTSRYLLFDEAMQLKGWQNVQTGALKGINSVEEIDNLHLTPFAFSGLHLINQSIFTEVTQQGKFSMVDAYLSLMAQKNLYGFNHTGCKFIDVGKPESLEKAQTMFT